MSVQITVFPFVAPPVPPPPPPPPPVPVPEFTFVANPTHVNQNVGNTATSTLSWGGDDKTTDFCLASNGWSGAKATSSSQQVTPTATTTYTLACGNETGTTTKNVEVTVTPFVAPPPPPSAARLLITEVYYDVASTTVGAADPANEWVEILNAGGTAIDLNGFTIRDNNATDTISSSIVLQPGAFLVIVASSTTSGFWSIPGSATILVLTGPIGNGLTNTGDTLFLRDPLGTLVDSVSWGDDTTAFNPSVPDVADGRSIARTAAGIVTDTDTAADWEDRATPNPGQAPLAQQL